MLQLRIKDGPGEGLVFALEKELMVMGRDASCDIQLPDQGVSRRHAEIYRVGKLFFIRDLGSRNGTFVNDERVDEELLREGDIIMMGATVLVLEESSGNVPTKDVVYSRAADPARTIEFKVNALRDLLEVEEPDVRPHQTVESRYLSFLYQMSRQISRGRDEGALLEEVARLAAEAISADECYVLLLDRKRDLKMAALYQATPGSKPVVSRTVVEPVLKHGRAVLTPRVREDSALRDKSSVVMARVTSLLCVPIVAAEKVLGALYLTTRKPYHSFSGEDLELMVAAGVQLGTALHALRAEKRERQTALAVIRVLVEATESRDASIAGHSELVADTASAIADVLNLPSSQKDVLTLAALLHNIGRLTITEEEFRRVADDHRQLEKRMAHEAERILSNIGGLDAVIPAIKHSYEHFDGSGAPDGLKGKEIPLLARIVAVARQFALVSKSTGSYAEAFSHLNELVQRGWLDPNIVRALGVAYRRGAIASNSEDSSP